ncbi:MAG TPA: DUF4381 domain-containing protein [Bryobacteraceae bacterium]|nr:DUF4381 domain-containing protein [Bryobacteraceae bacterium]
MKSHALNKLHGFYQPEPPSWMPQTIGWYVVFALIVLLAAWAAWRMFARWRHNRYRRDALRELELAKSAEIPALLKRTALAAWPREQVAALSGEGWLAFLEKHGGRSEFSNSAGHLLLELDYRARTPTKEEEHILREAAADWIRRHRVHV